MLEEDFLPVGDYVSPGFSIILPDQKFPNLIIGDKKYSTWRYSRREIPHNRYVDQRFPAVGFNNRDEVHILYNTALKFKGKKALEIGCWLGWSAININCSNQTGLLTEYNRRIIELMDSNPGQLSKEEYSYITNIVINRKPSNFLVFGVGKDSKFWMEVNKNGETIFLEDSRDWLNQVKAYCPQIKAYLVEYGTTRKQWLDLLEQYRQGIDSLLMILPEKITQTKWDVIFVDAPAGYSDEVSGRMKSIYLAAKLALNSGNTDVFVHDCDRQVEKIYSSYFLKNENLVTQVKKLNHYKIINANLSFNSLGIGVLLSL